MRALLAIALAAMLVVSCSSEEPSKLPAGKAAAPEASHDTQAVRPPDEEASSSGGIQGALQITPSVALRNTTLRLVARGFNIDDARVIWLVSDGEVTMPEPAVFDPAEAEVRKGDTIQAKAIIGQEAILSDAIRIRNAVPEFTSVKIMPEVFRPGDKVGVEAEARDLDGDPVLLSYEWNLNGQPAGSGKTIGAEIKRGDVFTVTIRPYDGEEFGRDVFLQREVANLPPAFDADKGFEYQIQGQLYTFQARAMDPDGDSVAYSLKSGPEGMTIDPSTGFVRWVMPAGFSGTQPFTVSVTDGQGGEALQTFNITLTIEKRGGGPESKGQPEGGGASK